MSKVSLDKKFKQTYKFYDEISTNLRDDLDTLKGFINDIEQEYDSVISEYDEMVSELEGQVADLEQELDELKEGTNNE